MYAYISVYIYILIHVDIYIYIHTCIKIGETDWQRGEGNVLSVSRSQTHSQMLRCVSERVGVGVRVGVYRCERA